MGFGHTTLCLCVIVGTVGASQFFMVLVWNNTMATWHVFNSYAIVLMLRKLKMHVHVCIVFEDQCGFS